MSGMTKAQMKKAYEEELIRKDDLIEALREENGFLLRTAMKSTEDRLRIAEMLDKLKE